MKISSQNLNNQINSNPWRSLFIAAGLGVAASLLLGRSSNRLSGANQKLRNLLSKSQKQKEFSAEELSPFTDSTQAQASHRTNSRTSAPTAADSP